ncbi:MAG: GtrA family protein [Pseudomonadota bacterium]
MISRQRIDELTRYVVTGGLCVLLNVGIAYALTEYLGIHYLLSLALCSIIVTVVGFVLNKSWTFRTHGSAALPEFLRYSLVTGMNIIIGMCFCALLVERLHVPYLYAIAIVGVVFAPLTYLVHRAWTFGLSWLYGK